MRSKKRTVRILAIIITILIFATRIILIYRYNIINNK